MIRVPVSEDHSIDLVRTRSCPFEVDLQLARGRRELPSPGIDQDLVLASRDQQARIPGDDLIGAKTTRPQLVLELLRRQIGEEQAGWIAEASVAHRDALNRPDFEAIWSTGHALLLCRRGA